jgi:hypothetical protein
MKIVNSVCRHCKIDRSVSQCKCCCSEECPYIDDDNAPEGPCEGPCEVVDEINGGDDWYWVHRCQKHAKVYYKLFI